MTALCRTLQRAAQDCGDPVFVVDEHLTVAYWNPAAESAFGVSSEAVIGRPCFEVLAGRNAGGRLLCQPRCEKWALARRGARIHNFDLHALPRPGVWLNVSLLPIADPSGRIVALLHVVRNVNHVKRLEHYVRELANSAAEVLVSQPRNGPPPEPAPVHLTARELEVLQLVARGADTATIAERLGISRHTAHNHVAAVLHKLGVHSRVEAAAYAFEHRLV